MIPKKAVPYGMLVSGILATILGIVFVASYIRDAIIARAGEPDQSLIFWYLPILLLGIISMLVGFGLSAWGFSLLRRLRRQMIGPRRNPGR